MVLIKFLVFRSSVKLWEMSREFGFSSFLLFYIFCFLGGRIDILELENHSHTFSFLEDLGDFFFLTRPLAKLPKQKDSYIYIYISHEPF